jgi:hypothetical protein
VPIAGRFGWGEIEMPVTEAADGVGDQRRDCGQIDRVDALALRDEFVDHGGDVGRGRIEGAVGDQLVELEKFFLLDGVVVGDDAFFGAEAQPAGEPVEGLDPVGDRGDCSRSAGSDRYRGNTWVRTTRPSSRNAW